MERYVHAGELKCDYVRLPQMFKRITTERSAGVAARVCDRTRGTAEVEGRGGSFRLRKRSGMGGAGGCYPPAERFSNLSTEACRLCTSARCSGKGPEFILTQWGGGIRLLKKDPAKRDARFGKHPTVRADDCCKASA